VSYLVAAFLQEAKAEVTLSRMEVDAALAVYDVAVHVRGEGRDAVKERGGAAPYRIVNSVIVSIP
jgi:hypothetical protein